MGIIGGIDIHRKQLTEGIRIIRDQDPSALPNLWVGGSLNCGPVIREE